MEFGDIPPKVENVETHGTPEGQETTKSVTIDFDFIYVGNCDLQVSILGIDTGVRWLLIITPTNYALKKFKSLFH